MCHEGNLLPQDKARALADKARSWNDSAGLAGSRANTGYIHVDEDQLRRVVREEMVIYAAALAAALGVEHEFHIQTDRLRGVAGRR